MRSFSSCGVRLALLLAAWVESEVAALGAAGRIPYSALALPQDPPDADMQVVQAFPGVTFVRPVALVSPPGETNRLFVVEKAGKIFVITNLAAPDKTLFLDLEGRVEEEWYNENGLLGLAFHPHYRAGSPGSSNFVYVFYTGYTVTASGTGFHDRLVRYEINPTNASEALIDSETALISQYDEDVRHNGGDLHFGPDGYLYVATGDEGGPEGKSGNSRTITKDLFGAILRIDVDRRPGNAEPNPHPAVHTDESGMARYAVPVDNPFLGATQFNGQAIDPSMVRTEFWAVGFRNPWRFSFDAVTGDLYCGDVGQYQREEIDVVVRGGDYGWNYSEGAGYFQGGIPSGTIGPADLTLPVIDYPHSAGPEIPGGKAEGAAVVGGVVYRGSRDPQMAGEYIFGDYVSGRIFALRWSNGTAVNFRQIATIPNPAAFGRDPSNGDVLIARYDELSGNIQRLIFSAQGEPGDSLPATLSLTGAFRDLERLDPSEGVIPYEVNVPFWSDYAHKRRWFSIPETNQMMTFSAAGNWQFPTGTVWIKHFDLELTNGVPESQRRLETRFLVKNTEGVHGFTYRWNSGQSDADLVEVGGQDELIPVYRPDGSLLRNQTWRYPGRSECLQCHTPQSGYALGFNTVQFNRTHDDGDGLTNQIARLSALGYFDGPTPAPETLPRLVPARDVSASLEHRARSYLHANCVQCHQPGGVAQGTWDARIATPLNEARILNGEVVNNYGDSANRVIRPGSLEQSVLFRRISQPGPGHMPPLGTSELNEEAIDLLSQWIAGGGSSVVVTMDGDGYVHLVFPGVAGQTYQIEATDDLVTWEPVGSVRAPATGVVKFLESNDERRKSRFYRIASSR